MGSAIDIDPLTKDRDLDFEKDSLHILPLHIIPFKTPGLRRARMVKDAQCDSMIELFRDDETGSGLVDPSKLSTLFDWPKGRKHADAVLIAKLSLLQSFDVYSLRINLRNLGINVENISDLRLSAAKRDELNRYMADFTRPLVDIINADDDNFNFEKISDLLNSAKSKNNSLKNLKNLSKKLKIILSQLPAFITDYGDVFLSLAYFKERHDDVSEKLSFFKNKLAVLKGPDSLPRENELALSIESDLDAIINSIRTRLADFDAHTESMWENLTAEKFRKVKNLIESNHAIVGGLLCGVQIKLTEFHTQWQKSTMSNRQLVDYIQTYMQTGLDRIMDIDQSAHYAGQGVPHKPVLTLSN